MHCYRWLQIVTYCYRLLQIVTDVYILLQSTCNHARNELRPVRLLGAGWPCARTFDVCGADRRAGILQGAQ